MYLLNSEAFYIIQLILLFTFPTIDCSFELVLYSPST